MHRSNFPPSKSDLKNHFGYLSFHCNLINLDVVAIQFVKSGEIVVITYRGNRKTGFIYEGDFFNQNQVWNAYKKVPETRNELEEYEREHEGIVEILDPPKDNYVFINDMEVKPKYT